MRVPPLISALMLCLLGILCPLGTEARAQCDGVELDFDTVANVPATYAAATVLRSEFAETGVVFSPPDASNGPVLRDVNNTAVTGLSFPNAIAINPGATIDSGGTAVGPLRADFDTPVTRVQLRVAAPARAIVMLRAFDRNDTEVDTRNDFMDTDAITLSVSAPSIAYVTVESSAVEWFIDNLCIAGNPLAEACASDRGTTQAPYPSDDDRWAFEPSSVRAGAVAYDRFSSVLPIAGVRWWGHNTNADGEDCSPQPRTFDIRFYADNNGEPGTLVAARTGLTANPEATGSLFTRAETFREFSYSVRFDQVVDLASGWIAIVSTDDQPCDWAWGTSPDGDGSYVVSPLDQGSFNPRTTRDLAFCIQPFVGTAPSCATVESAAKPPFGPLDDYAFYPSGVPDERYFDAFEARLPIEGVRWWGLEVDGELDPCELSSTRFSVGFWETSNGFPDAVLFEDEFIATRTPTGRIFPLGNQRVVEYQYEVSFDTPLLIPTGLVSIYRLDDDACEAFWLGSPTGTAVAANADLTEPRNLTSGLSYCLIGDAGEPLQCPAESAFGQRPDQADRTTFVSSNLFDDQRYADDFSGLSEPITGGRLYAALVESGNDCAAPFVELDIEFYAPGTGGVPGTLLRQESVTATVTARDRFTGQCGFTGCSFRQLYEISFALDTPLDLAEGWVSFAREGAAPCALVWASALGTGNAKIRFAGEAEYRAENPDPDTNDLALAFCLDTESPCGGPIHTADQDADNAISLSELLRVIQFFNTGGFGCEGGTEDGYAPAGSDQGCCPHSSDYAAQDWTINLTELLRLIQFFNSDGYNLCPGSNTEDGYCPGAP